MKVKIGKYRRWNDHYSWWKFCETKLHIPTSVLEKVFPARLFRWLNKHTEDRKVSVRIDDYDTWNADHTLALIILPLLKKIKEDKAGVPHVDPKDVPKELRPTRAEIRRAGIDGTTDQHYEARWNYVLDEMIFAFESIVDTSWEEQFHSGISDYTFEEIEDEYDGEKLYQVKHGPNHTHEFDFEGYKAYHARIEKGLILFGKYFRSLWT